MHTRDHIQAAGGVDPEALDDRVAEMYHRGVATEEPQAAPPHARPLSDALGYAPLCAHGMNSFTDRGYDLALARLRRG
jgi:hypothetical protein